MDKIRKFRFWCQKVLPLVYDDSLSYYEVLCKVVDYLNHVIQDTNTLIDDVDDLKAQVDEFQEFIDNFDTAWAKEVIEEYIASMIFVEINDAGYIVYNIPGGWDRITFYTTGRDIFLPLEPEYGHLVLAY